MSADPTRSASPRPQPDLDQQQTRSVPPGAPDGATAEFDPSAPASHLAGFADRLAALAASESTRDAADTAATAPVSHVPGYELLGELGRGGMGVVLQARQVATNRVVAVKLILAGEFAGAAARDRFRAEVETTAKLSHPNIVQIFEAGEADGRAFLSCEFVPGGSLASRLDGTPWEARRAAALLVPLARAVAHAHAAGIIHRDLKPSNVLVAADGTPKVADFGVAKRLDSDSHTHTGAILGTPSYMPPEQAGGARNAGAGADVYSLGAILYELLTGRPPFNGADFVETIDQVRTQEPVAPRVLQPRLPRDVETICLKCLQKDPAKRYPTADALADDLQRFLDGKPIQARPVGSFERAWRWCRRNPAVAGLLAAVLLVFAAGTGFASYFAVKAGKRAHEAADSAALALEREREAKDAKKAADDLSASLLTEQERTDRLLYASRISQTRSPLTEFRTDRLREVLEEAKPTPGRPDLRGWEWHYLDRLARPWASVVKLETAAIPKSETAAIPAGRGVVITQGPVTVQFSSQRLSHHQLTADGSRLSAWVGTYQPDPDGSDVRLDGVAEFDTTTGKLHRLVSWPAVTPRTEVEVSPDGRFVTYIIASAQELPPGFVVPKGLESTFRIQVVELASGREVRSVLAPSSGIPHVWVSNGGRRITVLPRITTAQRFVPGGVPLFDATNRNAGSLATLMIWENEQPLPAFRTIRTGPEKTPVAPDVLSADGTVAVIRKPVGKWPPPPNNNNVGGPTVIDSSGQVVRPPPGTLATPQGDMTLEFWDLTTDPPMQRGPVHAHPGGVSWMQASAGATALAVGDGSAGISVYDLPKATRVGTWTPPGSQVSVTPKFLVPLAISDDGRRVVEWRADRLVVGERIDTPPADDAGVWQSFTLRMNVSREWRSASTTPTSARRWAHRLTPDGSRLVVADLDGTVWTVDLAANREYAATWRGLPADDPKRSFNLYPDSRGRFVTSYPLAPALLRGLEVNPVAIFDTASGHAVSRLTLTDGRISFVRVTPDGKRLLLGFIPFWPDAPGVVGFGMTPRASLRSVDDPATEIWGSNARTVLTDDGRWLLEEVQLGTPLTPMPLFTGYKVRRTEGGAERSFLAPAVPGSWLATVLGGPSSDRLVLVDTRYRGVRTRPGPPRGSGGNRPPGATQPKQVQPPEPEIVETGEPAQMVTLRCFVPETGRALWSWQLAVPVTVTERSNASNDTIVGGLSAVRYSPDGRQIAVAVRTGKGDLLVSILDAATGTSSRELRTSSRVEVDQRPSALTFGPDGLFMIDDGRDAVVWGATGSEPTHRLTADSEIARGLFSPDGKRLFTLETASSQPGVVRVWDLAAGRELMALPVAVDTLGGRVRSVWGDLWLDGGKLMLRAPDGVRVWDGTPRKE